MRINSAIMQKLLARSPSSALVLAVLNQYSNSGVVYLSRDVIRVKCHLGYTQFKDGINDLDKLGFIRQYGQFRTIYLEPSLYVSNQPSKPVQQPVHKITPSSEKSDVASSSADEDSDEVQSSQVSSSTSSDDTKNEVKSSIFNYNPFSNSSSNDVQSNSASENDVAPSASSEQPSEDSQSSESSSSESSENSDEEDIDPFEGMKIPTTSDDSSESSQSSNDQAQAQASVAPHVDSSSAPSQFAQPQQSSQSNSKSHLTQDEQNAIMASVNASMEADKKAKAQETQPSPNNNNVNDKKGGVTLGSTTGDSFNENQGFNQKTQTKQEVHDQKVQKMKQDLKQQQIIEAQRKQAQSPKGQLKAKMIAETAVNNIIQATKKGVDFDDAVNNTYYQLDDAVHDNMKVMSTFETLVTQARKQMYNNKN